VSESLSAETVQESVPVDGALGEEDPTRLPADALDGVDSEGSLPPAWLREIYGLLGVVSQFVLYGNVRDQVLTYGPGSEELQIAADPVMALVPWLEHDGYQVVFRMHPFGGLRCVGGAAEDRDATARLVLGQKASGLLGTSAVSAEAIVEVLQVVVNSSLRAAIFVEDVVRLAANPSSLAPEQQALFASAELLARTAEPRFVADTRKARLFNAVMWMTPSASAMPDWLLTSNERVRAISVPLPELGQREDYARILSASFADYRDADEDVQRELVSNFCQQTHGMMLAAMEDITRLALGRDEGMSKIEDAARCYRVGIFDNPWREAHLKERIDGAEAFIAKRLIGQHDAVRKSLDIVIRSATGLTGAHASANATRPRGVLFFAGPTGVGKTELAKALTELIFGDERAYVRFDMSEFSSEHNAARLIGAPPGYTGFDAGGELTNAVRERPFSLLLFDEIDKADSQILDKFLQVLEDGRLTDGRGSTVFFTEAILVFTSNLGVYEEQPDGTRELVIDKEMNREEVDEKIRGAITRHFHNKLGRPELLNRLGEVVVFDFIKREEAERIFEILLGNVKRRVQREQRCTLAVSAQARADLLERSLADLSYGGRGIGAQLEKALVDPLARALFAARPEPGSTVTVERLHPHGRTFELELSR
jgi:ATP-dependent Clp protease ATP-binding subunit ClpB